MSLCMTDQYAYLCYWRVPNPPIHKPLLPWTQFTYPETNRFCGSFGTIETNRRNEQGTDESGIKVKLFVRPALDRILNCSSFDYFYRRIALLIEMVLSRFLKVAQMYFLDLETLTCLLLYNQQIDNEHLVWNVYGLLDISL